MNITRQSLNHSKKFEKKNENESNTIDSSWATVDNMSEATCNVTKCSFFNALLLCCEYICVLKVEWNHAKRIKDQYTKLHLTLYDWFTLSFC